ncbi:MAG: LacI family transcriptional regulator [Spirochaetaceae bacterium]|nr:LacI family transcriptional regulator [Spirochaetaceae bacterium]
MASLKDVARLAGVSTSTVSRVINKNIPVSEETTAHVEKAIRDINFKPNLVARGLRMKKAKLIGIVIPEFQHETFTSFVRFTEEYAELNGYNVIIGCTNSNYDKEERLLENLLRRNIDGIIFARISDKSHTLKVLDRTQLPAVIIDRTLEREDIPAVVIDNYASGRIAAEHLLSLGHRNFACITGPLDIAIVRERTAGFCETIKAAGGTIEDKAVVEGNFKYDSGVRAVDFLLDSGKKFTGIWAQNDYMAIGAMNRMAERGLKVPDEVSVMGLDNIETSWMLRPKLTTIAQPFREICRNAVDIIIRLSQEGSQEENKEKIKVVLQPELVLRETTAAPPAKKPA